MDAAMLELLQRQMAGGGTNVQDLLGGMAGADPALGLIAQMLSKREQELEKTIETQGTWGNSEVQTLERELQARGLELDQLNQDHQTQLQGLHQRFERMRGELEASRAQLDELALALGACPNCWGQDQACRLCRGRGKPGFLRVDAQAFARWVAPVMSEIKPITASSVDGALTPERIPS
jgi:hypothetical protein